jgi:cell wall-associated NlpC family hydrolase
MMDLDLTPHAQASHWSAPLVGLPWKPGAEGPDAFDCWGLVKHVQAHVFGRAMPALAVNVREAPKEQWAAIRTLVQRSAWQRVAYWRAGDVLLMLNALGLPHVGVVIEGDRLLHAQGGEGEDGKPFGSVSADPIGSLGRLGYGHLEAWRHA